MVAHRTSRSVVIVMFVLFVLVLVMVFVVRCRLVDDRIEAVVLVGRIVDRSNGAIRFDQRVLA